MADDTLTVSDPSGPGSGANGFGPDDGQPQVAILAQYVKDLSFENPGAPATLQMEAQPRIEINVNVQAKTVGEDVYEVELKIDATAKIQDGEQVAFAIQLVYAGLFGLKNIPQDQLEPFMVVEAPRLLFPFARRVVADASRDGGFPPLMLEPIDFGGLYMAQRGQLAGGQPMGNA